MGILLVRLYQLSWNEETLMDEVIEEKELVRLWACLVIERK